MKLRSTTAAAAMVIGAMTIGLGTAHADPAATPEPEQSLRYSVKLVEKTVVTTLKGGTFELAKSSEDVKENDVYKVKDSHGNTVLAMPIAFKVAETVVPVKPVLKDDDTVLELTPDQTVAVPKDKPVNTVNVVAQPIASPMENQRAQNEFASQFGIATAVGGFLGTAVGVVAGAVIGCILGLPLLGVGCIPAAVAGAGIGGILGTVAIGGPALLVAGMDLINTIQAPEGTTKWADKPK